MTANAISVVFTLLTILASMKPTSASEEIEAKVETLIIEGTPLPAHSVPWLLSLQKQSAGKFLHWCGAILLAPDVAVTEARCVKNSGAVQFRLVAGEHDLKKDEGTEQIRDIVNTTLIPSTDVDSKKFLRVLEFQPAFELNKNVQLATWTKSPCLVDGDVKVVGWGFSKSSPAVMSTPFQIIVPVVQDEECEKILGHQIFMDQICVGGNGKGICNGDQGGPVMSDSLVVALAYASASKCDATKPNTHLRLGNFAENLLDFFCKKNFKYCHCLPQIDVKYGIAQSLLTAICDQVDAYKASQEIQPPLKEGPLGTECPHFTWNIKQYGCFQPGCPYDQ